MMETWSAPAEGSISHLFLYAHPQHIQSLHSLQPQDLQPGYLLPMFHADLRHQQSHLRSAGGSGTLLNPMTLATQLPFLAPTVTFHVSPPKFGTFLQARRDVLGFCFFLPYSFNIFINKKSSHCSFAHRQVTIIISGASEIMLEESVSQPIWIWSIRCCQEIPAAAVGAS